MTAYRLADVVGMQRSSGLNPGPFPPTGVNRTRTQGVASPEAEWLRGVAYLGDG